MTANRISTKLTKAQRVALRFAARACASPEFGRETDGVHPRRGQTQMFEKLRRMGLLADAGPGISEDNPEREVHLYVITGRGLAALIPRISAEHGDSAA